MPKAPILLAAPALLGALGLAGCHPRHRATTPAASVPVAARTPVTGDSKPPCGCAVKVREPDQVIRTKERVLLTPAGSVDKVIPAVTRLVDRAVVVKPAWTQTLTHPAVFKTVWRTETTPGRAYAVSSPARWRTVTERVLVAPAHTVWKPSAGRPTTGAPVPGYAAYAPTGEVMCAVLIPAQYAANTRRELIAPPSRRIVEGAPTTHRVAERVLVSPQATRTIDHPAITRIIHETQVLTPAHVISVRTPPTWTMVDRTVRTPRYGWRPVRCAQPKRAIVHRSHPHAAPAGLEERPYRLPPHAAPYGERG